MSKNVSYNSCSRYQVAEQVGKTVMLWACIQEVLVSNLGRDITILTGFSWLSSIPSGERWDSTSIRPRSLPSKCSSIHYSLIILSFDAVWPKKLIASPNKPQTIYQMDILRSVHFLQTVIFDTVTLLLNMRRLYGTHLFVIRYVCSSLYDTQNAPMIWWHRTQGRNH
jgi:hypothetical protein